MKYKWDIYAVEKCGKFEENQKIKSHVACQMSHISLLSFLFSLNFWEFEGLDISCCPLKKLGYRLPRRN